MKRTVVKEKLTEILEDYHIGDYTVNCFQAFNNKKRILIRYMNAPDSMIYQTIMSESRFWFVAYRHTIQKIRRKL